MNRIYSSKALGYKDYSVTQRGELTMSEPEAVEKRLKLSPNAKELVKGLIEVDQLRLEDIINLTELPLEGASDLVGFLSRKGCIRRAKRGGYRKTSAFIDLLKVLDRANDLTNESLREQSMKEVF